VIPHAVFSILPPCSLSASDNRHVDEDRMLNQATTIVTVMQAAAAKSL
jgi:hypothetical protein